MQIDSPQSAPSGHSNIIVRSALSEEKNASDFAIAVEATRISMSSSFFQDPNHTLYLASHDNFVKPVMNNLLILGVRVQNINIRIDHLGIFINRRLHTKLDEVASHPLITLAQSLKVRLESNPCLDVNDLWNRLKENNIQINLSPGDFQLLVGELKNLRCIVKI